MCALTQATRLENHVPETPGTPPDDVPVDPGTSRQLHTKRRANVGEVRRPSVAPDQQTYSRHENTDKTRLIRLKGTGRESTSASYTSRKGKCVEFFQGLQRQTCIHCRNKHFASRVVCHPREKWRRRRHRVASFTSKVVHNPMLNWCCAVETEIDKDREFSLSNADGNEPSLSSNESSNHRTEEQDREAVRIRPEVPTDAGQNRTDMEIIFGNTTMRRTRTTSTGSASPSAVATPEAEVTSSSNL